MASTMNVNSINGINQAASTPSTVTASVNEDGTSVDSTTSRTSGTSTASAKTTAAANGLQKDDFLKLLMTELQNQDPLSPMDNAQMMTQMAQLQSIESSNNMSKAIENLDTSFKGTVDAQQSSAQSMVNATSVSLIGKKVTVRQDTVDWSGIAGKTETIRVHLGNNAGAQVQIFDDKGNIVKTLQTGDKDAQNASTVPWDGTADAGGYAPAGTYTIKIVGQDNDTSLYAFVEDTVQGVRFSSNGAKLEIGGKELTVANVMNVQPEDQTTGFDSISPSTAIGLIGKKVRVLQPTITFGNKNMENAQIKVNAEKLSPVTVSITDSSGETVATLNGQADENGTATLFWNGETLSGAYAEAGTYTVNVSGAKNNPSLYSFSEGTIDGISTTGAATQLRMNGTTIPLSRILDIS